jgi:hypothetical protein
MGNVIEIMAMDKVNKKGFLTKKISKSEYIYLPTGEIQEYKIQSKNRSENKESLRKTFKRIRELINTNFTGEKNELCFTITYKENMTDVKQLYKDFDKFIKRLRYKYPDIDYISVVEPQGRGAWHCHILLRFNALDKIYIANKDIAAIWGNGFVTVKAVKNNVDNMGAYLSAYLGDVEINNNIPELYRDGIIQPGQALNIKEVEVQGMKKKFIKGGRLNLYPVGMNIYRCSRGIKEPEKKMITYENAKKIVGAGTPNYSTRINILDDEGLMINSITYEQYNIKKLKLKGCTS